MQRRRSDKRTASFISSLPSQETAGEGALYQPLLRRRRADEPGRISQDDDIAQFIAKIERTDQAFQRSLSRAKVPAQELLRDRDHATADPGYVWLFTPRGYLRPGGDGGVGSVNEPSSNS